MSVRADAVLRCRRTGTNTGTGNAARGADAIVNAPQPAKAEVDAIAEHLHFVVPTLTAALGAARRCGTACSFLRGGARRRNATRTVRALRHSGPRCPRVGRRDAEARCVKPATRRVRVAAALAGYAGATPRHCGNLAQRAKIEARAIRRNHGLELRFGGVCVVAVALDVARRRGGEPLAVAELRAQQRCRRERAGGSAHDARPVPLLGEMNKAC